MEDEVDETLDKIKEKSEQSEDPDAFKARLLSRMERELTEDSEYREG